MKSAYSLLIVLLLLAIGCEQEPILSVNTGSLEFSGEGGTNTVPFMANKTWTASSSATWCRVSPSSGDASDNNNVTLSVTCEKNTTYEDRTCTITISSEGLTASVSVKQLMNYGLIAVQTSYELTPLAQELKVELRSNVNYQVSVDAGSTGWLKVVSTKGLESHTIVLEVGENTTGASRRGSVTIKDVQNGLSETVTVSQRPNPTGKVKDPDVASNLPGEANTFELDIETNISYFTIETPEWVGIKEQKVETRETTSLHAVFAVSANTTKDIRRGEIVLRTTDGTDIAFLKVQVLQNPVPSGIDVVDANFKSYLVANFDTDNNGEISEEEAAAIEKIEVSTDKIASMEEIAGFANLKSLICKGSDIESEGTGGQLKSLDVSKNKKLEELDCSNNQIASLDVSKNTSLKELDCGGNQIGSLDVSKNTSLTELSCGGNQIASLDVSKNTSLTELDCGGNQIASLDVSKNTALKELDCEGNKLSELDLSRNTALTKLYCAENQMTVIDVSNNKNLKDYHSDKIGFEDKYFEKHLVNHNDKNGDGEFCLIEASMTESISVATDNIKTMKELRSFPNLKEIECVGDKSGQLKEIDVSNNKKLESLSCANNQISSLDISGNKSLSIIDCRSNKLSNIDVTNNKSLQSLDCSNNQLTSLDVTQNTGLLELNCNDNQISELNVSNNTQLTTLYCSGNPLTTVDISNNPNLVNFQCNVAVPIADANFKAYLVSNYDSDGDGDISISEVLHIDEIFVTTDEISSMDEIKQFKNLKTLVAYGSDYDEEAGWGYGKLTILDVSQNEELDTLICINNQLTTLDVSKNKKLTYFICSQNKLTALDISNNTELKRLGCSHNQLTVLDVSKNKALVELNCSYNPLGNLDVSKNEGLYELSCIDTRLMKLDVSRNIELWYLYCSYNQLTNLDVSYNHKLRKLECRNNQLEALDVSRNSALNYLMCWENNLTKLDISNNTELETLWCDHNQLTSLDVTKNSKLKTLCFQHNLLTSINVTKNPLLDNLAFVGNQLTSINVSKNPKLRELWFGGNQLSQLDITNNPLLEILHAENNQLESVNLFNNTALQYIRIDSNNLTTLDVSNNLNLNYLDCNPNDYLEEIWLRTGQTIETFDYPSTSLIKYKNGSTKSILVRSLGNAGIDLHLDKSTSFQTPTEKQLEEISLKEIYIQRNQRHQK